jgi:hypothetical protein
MGVNADAKMGRNGFDLPGQTNSKERKITERRLPIGNLSLYTKEPIQQKLLNGLPEMFLM